MTLRTLPKVGLVVLPKDVNARVVACCASAAKLEACGEYEAAREALSLFWDGPLHEPHLQGLSDEAQTVLLLRCGSLTAWLGSKGQLKGWMEVSKNLLTRCSELALATSAEDAWLEAQRHLGNCYRREGAFAEAHAVLTTALNIAKAGSDLKLELTIALAIVHWSKERYEEALALLQSISSFVEQSRNEFIKCAFHNGVAINQKSLDKLDEAIIEMTACSYHAERAGHMTFLIAAEINLGNWFVTAKEYPQAHEHIARAEELARERGDMVHLAHSKDSRALAFFKERKYEAAERYARQSVELLERGDDHAFLVSSLLTHARILAKLRRYSQSMKAYLYAQEIAEHKISANKATQIGVELVFQVGTRICLDSEIGYDTLVKKFRESLIDAAMEDADGKMTEASRLLGMEDHQQLGWLLKNTFPHLRRTPPRRRSIIRPFSGKHPKEKR